jgi:hypothetical protein
LCEFAGWKYLVSEKAFIDFGSLSDSIDALAPFVHELIGPCPSHESFFPFLSLGFYVKHPLIPNILLDPEEMYA